MANKFGVKVGDVFHASWGYEQTNNNFFQVVELVGESSVRVREVRPIANDIKLNTSMSGDFTYDLSGIMDPVPFSVFIKDNERGDLKRLKSYRKDGTHPQFRLSSYADAYLVEGNEITLYESWYY